MYKSTYFPAFSPISDNFFKFFYLTSVWQNMIVLICIQLTTSEIQHLQNIWVLCILSCYIFFLFKWIFIFFYFFPVLLVLFSLVYYLKQQWNYIVHRAFLFIQLPTCRQYATVFIWTTHHQHPPNSLVRDQWLVYSFRKHLWSSYLILCYMVF